MQKAFKLFDPNTGAIVFRNCLTGVILTDAEAALVAPCPERTPVTNDYCIQPIDNENPALVEKHGKEVCTMETTFKPDGSVAEIKVINVLLLNAAGDDVTATHEKTDCPVGLIPVGEVCF